MASSIPTSPITANYRNIFRKGKSSSFCSWLNEVKVCGKGIDKIILFDIFQNQYIVSDTTHHIGHITHRCSTGLESTGIFGAVHAHREIKTHISCL